MKHMVCYHTICYDVCPALQTTSTHNIFYDEVRGPISTPGLFPYENISRVSVQTELHLIIEINQFSAVLAKTGVLGIMLDCPFCGS
ncbi:hypothetical protein TNIN_361141 [Trichonephila inaurata madagascariensis]|uniref:Uncharacterized protein n=1 Tax=Trichonephila inaurata madagascariensis TaxID=2747483 RepID=A0A8X7CD07_9ARAC|nr:hypothetical protein TNIN_361141 [Trichonephila inaurata madagascariensis]